MGGPFQGAATACSARSTISASGCGGEFETQRAGEIEEAGDQRAQAIHFAGNVAGQFGGEGLGGGQSLVQHFGGAFDDAERIANFVRQAGGELAERGQALGAARFGLGVFEAAVGVFEFFGEKLVAARLLAIFHGESDSR